MTRICLNLQSALLLSLSLGFSGVSQAQSQPRCEALLNLSSQTIIQNDAVTLKPLSPRSKRELQRSEFIQFLDGINEQLNYRLFAIGDAANFLKTVEAKSPFLIWKFHLGRKLKNMAAEISKFDSRDKWDAATIAQTLDELLTAQIVTENPNLLKHLGVLSLDDPRAHLMRQSLRSIYHAALIDQGAIKEQKRPSLFPASMKNRARTLQESLNSLYRGGLNKMVNSLNLKNSESKALMIERAKRIFTNLYSRLTNISQTYVRPGMEFLTPLPMKAWRMITLQGNPIPVVPVELALQFFLNGFDAHIEVSRNPELAQVMQNKTDFRDFMNQIVRPYARIVFLATFALQMQVAYTDVQHERQEVAFQAKTEQIQDWSRIGKDVESQLIQLERNPFGPEIQEAVAEAQQKYSKTHGRDMTEDQIAALEADLRDLMNPLADSLQRLESRIQAPEN